MHLSFKRCRRHKEVPKVEPFQTAGWDACSATQPMLEAGTLTYPKPLVKPSLPSSMDWLHCQDQMLIQAPRTCL